MCHRLVFVALWYWIEVRKISRPRTEQTVGERVNKSLPNSNSRDKSPSAAWVPRGTQQTACGSVGVLRVLGTQHRFWQAVEREKEQKLFKSSQPLNERARTEDGGTSKQATSKEAAWKSVWEVATRRKMPLLRQKLFQKVSGQEKLRDSDEVFFCETTNEIFSNYE